MILASTNSSPDSPGPTLKEASAAGDRPGQFSALVALMTYALCCVTFIAVITFFRDFWEVSARFGDNAAYLTIARAALHGRFSGPDLEPIRNYYRGTGYCVALVSKLTTLSPARCLPILGILCGGVAVFLCGRLWGWRVATLFAFLNIVYTQRLCLGGCEPFFVLFLFASLLLWKGDHPVSAMACAALATTVRPTGIFLLVALGVVLAWHRRWRKLLWGTLVAAALGALYLAPMVFAARNNMAPLTGYADDWNTSSPISVPFYPLFLGAVRSDYGWAFHLKICFYILLTLFGAVTLWRRRREAFAHPAEQVQSLFFLLFAAFCVSYNSDFAYDEFPRFIAPLVPQSVLDVRSRYLQSWVMWPLSALAGMLSAASALNVYVVYHLLVH